MPVAASSQTKLGRRPEVVEHPLQLGPVVDRELEVAVGNVGLLHEAQELPVVRLGQGGDLLVEDHVADRGDDDVAGLLMEQRIDPRFPVDAVGRLRGLQHAVVHRPALVEGQRLRRRRRRLRQAVPGHRRRTRLREPSRPCIAATRRARSTTSRLHPPLRSANSSRPEREPFPRIAARGRVPRLLASRPVGTAWWRSEKPWAPGICCAIVSGGAVGASAAAASEYAETNGGE